MNNENGEYRCNHAKSLRDNYSSPDCLMQLIPSGEDLYAIRNEANGEFFQDTIGSMSSQVSSDAQLWYIKPYGGTKNAYTIQNAKNEKYMTRKASQLHKGTPGKDEVWIIENRQEVITEDLANSYYGSLQNNENGEYRTDRATHLSKTMEIPTRLFKMIKLTNGHYAIQNQGNYEFFQSSISIMATNIVDNGQEWNIQPVNNKDGLYTIQNVKNGEYMTSHASQLHGGTPGKSEYWKIEKYPYLKTASWMGDNWNLLANKPLNKICIPGSHDSGTYEHSGLTAFGWVGNTKTQIFDIQMQLMQGIRVFDLRPALHNGAFFTYHASNVAGKLQGAIGAKMEDVFAQIRAFMSKPEHKHELIVLNFTHAMRWSGGGYKYDLTDNQKQQFIELVKLELGNLLIKRKATQLTELTCGDLLSNSANIICLFDNGEFGTTESETEKGIWNSTYFKTKGSYSDTNDLEKMIYTKEGDKNQSQLIQLRNSDRSFKANQSSFMFELCWQLTLGGFQSTVNTTSILELAAKANPALKPTLKQWMKDQIINKTVYPNIINTDACQESVTGVVELSLEITKHIQ
ncbi:MAG: hypothetical protein A3D31_00960 [Candidatus Fluviicola riflensis]|nr:MAG: hypothetical protein CHH17_04580 [Candidatus Fluviicola riflensis]OGS76175.1 MAG: hypothetical protein A3D31_00960 [Candidatus Fluviicola riflensis]OGS83281.1 MAG: hypothetical protein A2724_00880 [Fluviicola sp. RIFCSPHIGHO2_01_FULL_43_53]OGS83707.1 MAG: hypothetical protein A3E30_17565 [Fluviicola sp. RIFCSPHIGHO2_12_FULL_43_24]